MRIYMYVCVHIRIFHKESNMENTHILPQKASVILYQILLCNIHKVKHNSISISSIVGIQLQWVQLHVSALYTGHLQVVF